MRSQTRSVSASRCELRKRVAPRAQLLGEDACGSRRGRAGRCRRWARRGRAARACRAAPPRARGAAACPWRSRRCGAGVAAAEPDARRAARRSSALVRAEALEARDAGEERQRRPGAGQVQPLGQVADARAHRGSSGSPPSTRHRARWSGRTMPSRVLMKVVLPAPLGPMSPKAAPSVTVVRPREGALAARAAAEKGPGGLIGLLQAPRFDGQHALSPASLAITVQSSWAWPRSMKRSIVAAMAGSIREGQHRFARPPPASAARPCAPPGELPRRVRRTRPRRACASRAGAIVPAGLKMSKSAAASSGFTSSAFASPKAPPSSIQKPAQKPIQQPNNR